MYFIPPALKATWKSLTSSLTKSNPFLITNNRKVNPNVLGKDNWSPLEIAVQSGFFQIVDILKNEKKTKLNQVNNPDRGSALHLAAKSNNLPVCQILLLADIDLTITDSQGKLAKELTTAENITLLIEKYEKLERREAHRQGDFDEIKEEDEFDNDDDESVQRSMAKQVTLEEERVSVIGIPDPDYLQQQTQSIMERKNSVMDRKDSATLQDH